MPDNDSFAKWQSAYLQTFQPASVGRLIKGTIHNLNGVIQAFSMQTELFEMMFAKSDRQLGEALEKIEDETARGLVESTRELLLKRQAMLSRMEEKITYSQELLNTTVRIAQASNDTDPITLSQLLRNIVSFFHSDMFFKHKVEQSMDLQASIDISDRQPCCIIMIVLMENAIAAMQQGAMEEPRCHLCTRKEGDRIFIELSNNGPQIPAELHEQIFQPFFTTFPDKAGLGLYLARQVVAGCHGEISFSSSPQETTFRVSLPATNF